MRGGYMSPTTRKIHDLKLKLRFVSRLWVKWNKKEISGDELGLRLAKGLEKETRQAWEKEIGIMNDKLYGGKEVKTLEDLLV